MALDHKSIKASCLCGLVKHEITLPTSNFPLKSCLCHCNSCRHMTGCLCLTVAFLPPQYKPKQTLLDQLRPFRFSKRITQYHCLVCGTQMLWRCFEDGDDPQSPVQWDVACGTLERADNIYEVHGHEHIADTLDGGFADFLPSIDNTPVERWPHHFRKGEQIPLYWQSDNKSQAQASAGDRLQAHCLCGGVQFWIARPSPRSEDAECFWPDVLIPYHSDEPRPGRAPWWLREDGKKFLAGCCSCNSCRLACGMEWIQWAFIPTVDISLDPAGITPFTRDFGTLKHFRFSNHAKRSFCGTCGATVFFDGDDRPTLIDVAVGLLNAPEGARAGSLLDWTTHRLSYREDAIDRANDLTLAVENGLKKFGEGAQTSSISQ